MRFEEAEKGPGYTDFRAGASRIRQECRRVRRRLKQMTNLIVSNVHVSYAHLISSPPHTIPVSRVSDYQKAKTSYFPTIHKIHLACPSNNGCA